MANDNPPAGKDLGRGAEQMASVSAVTPQMRADAIAYLNRRNASDLLEVLGLDEPKPPKATPGVSGSARSIACPDCHVRPGAQCVSRNGKVVGGSHAARTRTFNRESHR